MCLVCIFFLYIFQFIHFCYFIVWQQWLLKFNNIRLHFIFVAALLRPLLMPNIITYLFCVCFSIQSFMRNDKTQLSRLAANFADIIVGAFVKRMISVHNWPKFFDPTKGLGSLIFKGFWSAVFNSSLFSQFFFKFSVCLQLQKAIQCDIYLFFLSFLVWFANGIYTIATWIL